MADNGITVTFEDGGIAVITMCRGENKFNTDYLTEWNNALDKVERNQECKALITTGRGKFFSSGMDVAWLQRSDPATLDLYHDNLHQLYRRILILGITTVAVINGHAIAEGAFLAMMHDFRVMRSDRGFIVWPEVHVKLPMTKTMLDLVRAKIPAGNAQREAVIFGKRLDASAAKHLGIVDDVTPQETLMSAAKERIATLLGRNLIDTTILKAMKEDLYDKYICDETLSKSNL